MLNTMGLSIVAASYALAIRRRSPARASRMFALATAAITHAHAARAGGRGWRRCRIRSRPICGRRDPTRRFRCFRGRRFSFAGVLVGDLVDAVRDRRRAAQIVLQNGFAVVAAAGRLARVDSVVSTGALSERRLLARLADVFLHPPGPGGADASGGVGRRAGCCPSRLLQPLVTLGRSSLFVYWIHVEMVYGVIAEPLEAAAAAVGIAGRRRRRCSLSAVPARAAQEPLARTLRTARACECSRQCFADRDARRSRLHGSRRASAS